MALIERPSCSLASLFGSQGLLESPWLAGPVAQVVRAHA